MKPLELEIEGFGPYLARQHVRFDKLDPLFLIGGDTGAGKTSLFDAMSYALYGEPLGTRQSKGVRSELATDDVSTRVRLRFVCAHREWEVIRSPHLVRPAKRGSTPVVETAFELAELLPDGTRRPITGTAKQLNEHIEKEIVKLRHEEFSKILVLPQGEFQKFLEMDSASRATLLEKLFPVVDHRRLLERATQAAAAAVKERDRLTSMRDEVMRQFNPSTFPADEAARTEALAKATAASREADVAFDAASKLASDGENLAKAHQELASVAAEERRLASEHNAVEAARLALDGARRAASASVPLERADAAKLEADRRIAEQKAAKEAREAYAKDQADAGPRAQALPGLELELKRLETGLPGLCSRRDDLAALITARAARSSHAEGDAGREANRAAAEALVAKAEQELEALAKAATDRDALGEPLRACQEAIQRLETCRGQVEILDRWAREHGSLQSAVAASQAIVQERTNHLKTAKDQLEAAERRRRSQQAAHLAERLSEGEPCLVCGSREHPAPARYQNDGADLAAWIASLEAAVTEAERALQKALARSQADQTTLKLNGEAADAASTRLTEAGFVDAATWRDQLADAEREQKSLRASDEALRKKLAARPAAEAGAKAARDKLQNAEAAINTASREAAALEGRIAELEARVGDVTDAAAERAGLEAQIFADEASVRQCQQELQTLRQLLAELERRELQTRTELEGRDQELIRAKQALDKAIELLSAALAQAGFSDAAAARAAVVPAEEQRRLESLVDQWTRAEEKARNDRSRLERDIEGRPIPDLAGLKGALAEADDDRRRLLELKITAEKLLADLRGLKQRYDELEADLQRGDAAARGLLQLLDDLDGNNALKVKFPAWVLSFLLEDVLVRATDRLKRLSEGRYAFALRTAATDKRKQAGLDVDVFDSYSASRRDVRSLSGGEKFLASLSLALGLADVIQERAGGVELDALFIDEGFGSLDAGTMDRALTILSEIGAHRQVGVISHVEGMKKAIPCHLLVHKGLTGSRIVAGGAP